GHRNIIVDEATRQSFINNALIPMLQYPVAGTEFTIGTHPNVLGWGIINEPEWAIVESGSVKQEITEPVSLAEMQRFVAEVAGAIHRNSNQLVTLGSASMKWNSSQAKGAVGNWWGDAALTPFDPQGNLDFYSVHYYSWMEGDGQSWSYSPLVNSWEAAGFDKPVVIGELPANDGATGNGRSLRDLLEGIYSNCYAGAWVWSYEGVDGNGNWDTARTAFTEFNRQWLGETRVRPGVTR
nr:hypothetical protein [Chloroflexaceae bacterium]